MYNLFEVSGKVDFDFLYKKEEIPLIIKNLLARLVSSIDRFDVEFVSNNRIKFKQNIFKLGASNFTDKSSSVIICNGDFTINKNDKGLFSIEYHLDNSFYVYYWIGFTLLIALALGLIALADPGKAEFLIFTFFLFESLLWGMSFILFSVIPKIRFLSYIKEAVKKR